MQADLEDAQVAGKLQASLGNPQGVVGKVQAALEDAQVRIKVQAALEDAQARIKEQCKLLFKALK